MSMSGSESRSGSGEGAPSPSTRRAGLPLTVGDLGEFGTIARIREWIASAAPQPADATVRIGIGDDVAVTRPPEGSELLLTCDVQIAGHHFVPAWMTGAEVGRRALEVNLSDVAAKGGTPLWVVLSLGLPPEFRIADLEHIYRGILQGLADAGDGTVVGGNLVSSGMGDWFLDMTLIGAAPTGRAATRAGAQPGDLVFVTGYPGASAAGLVLMRALSEQRAPETSLDGDRTQASASGTGPDGWTHDRHWTEGKLGSRTDLRDRAHALGPPFADWIDSYLRPRCRLAFGQALVARQLVHAMIDVSDGILGDLFHLCDSSRVASTLEVSTLAFPPYDPSVLAKMGVTPGPTPWPWILGPSDDYELLFSAPPSAQREVLDLGRQHGVVLREIGEIRSGDIGVHIRGHGAEVPDQIWTPARGSGGFDHFGPPGTPA